MVEVMVGIVVVLQLLGVGLLFVLWRGQSSNDTGTLRSTCEALQKGQERLEAIVREEMVSNRRETAEQARAARDESNAVSAKLSDKFDGLVKGNHEFSEKLSANIATGLGTLNNNFTSKLQEFAVAEKLESDRFREENNATLKAMGEWLATQLVNNLNLASGAQKDQLAGFEVQLKTLVQTNKEDAGHLRKELFEGFNQLASSVSKNFSAAGETQRGQFDSFTKRIEIISENADKKSEVLRGVVDDRLKSLQEDNGKKLDLMRQTVDEKLQGTLDKRLGESFKIVSERLELVHAGLGEMRTLANGVGDLKKVLTNVKTRGNWGEIQLGNLLEQMLTAQQYDKNVVTIPGSSERVEFAIRLPGQNEGQDVVWLPIDAKFPQEDYARLVEAHDAGNLEAIEAIGKQLETQIKKCAQDICSKYLQAPYTTDFGIMFLPIEGLYAEVIRRTGLVDVLHRECRVTIAGPTTLAAILNSLQMGFRTLAIQERSSEVWSTLSAVKTEFGKYGDVLDAVQKKLKEASDKIDTTRTRSRAIERKLKDVELLPEATVQSVALLAGADLIDESLHFESVTSDIA